MKDYTSSLYKLNLDTGTYTFDITFPELFLETEFTNLPYHHVHSRYEVVFICGKTDKSPRYFQINPPKCKHAVYVEDQREPLYMTSFRFAVKKGQTADVQEPSSGGSVLEAFFDLHSPVVVQDTFRGEDRILAVRREVRERKPGYREVVRAELLLLLLEIARHLPAEQEAEQPPQANLDEMKLDMIDDFFVQNFDRPSCKREDLAQLLCISERQLSRIFAQNYMQSFRERLLQTRMEMAEVMRKNERLSAEELSERVGYSSASAFRAAYKHYFGRSFREK